MSLDTFFPHLRGFRLLSSSRETKRLVLTCEPVTQSAPCPVCGTCAHRIHSRYQRTVWDLSVQNVQVLLHLHVRKFYCDQPDCPRRIFTERLPQVTSPHGRFTFGLRQFLGQLGQQQGGASAACSATLMGLQVTARAILRFMHSLLLPPIAPPRIIGLDDWAWKRGQYYGAIMVDLERKKPIALLADRSQEAVAGWLKRYPTIQIVARDRSKEFAAAITAALPQATHVADRWHLAKNLTEHLNKVVSARWKQLTKATNEDEMAPEPVPVSPPARQPCQAPGYARYQQMLALKEAGLPTRTIAKRLRVGQRTIQRWLAEGHGPYAGPRKPRPEGARLVNAVSAAAMGGGRAQRHGPLGGVEGPGLPRIAAQCLSASGHMARSPAEAGRASIAWVGSSLALRRRDPQSGHRVDSGPVRRG